jgi:hypothetical protein
MVGHYHSSQQNTYSSNTRGSRISCYGCRRTIFLPSEYAVPLVKRASLGLTGGQHSHRCEWEHNNYPTFTTTAACTTVTASTAASATTRITRTANPNLFHQRCHPRPRSLYLPRITKLRPALLAGDISYCPSEYVPHLPEAGTLTKTVQYVSG